MVATPRVGIKALRRTFGFNAEFEALHPRDRVGRFIETGAEVRIWGGALARVLRNVGGGRMEVEVAGGQKRVIHRNYLTVTARPNGDEPTMDSAADVAEAPAQEPDTTVPDVTPANARVPSSHLAGSMIVAESLEDADETEAAAQVRSAAVALHRALIDPAGDPDAEADARTELLTALDADPVTSLIAEDALVADARAEAIAATSTEDERTVDVDTPAAAAASVPESAAAEPAVPSTDDLFDAALAEAEPAQAAVITAMRGLHEGGFTDAAHAALTTAVPETARTPTMTTLIAALSGDQEATARAAARARRVAAIMRHANDGPTWTADRTTPAAGSAPPPARHLGGPVDPSELFDEWSTRDDFDGDGYLAERPRDENGVTRTTRAVDKVVYAHAQRAGWTDEQLFMWATSEQGRQYANVVFEADGGPAAQRRREAVPYLNLNLDTGDNDGRTGGDGGAALPPVAPATTGGDRGPDDALPAAGGRRVRADRGAGGRADGDPAGGGDVPAAAGPARAGRGDGAGEGDPGGDPARPVPAGRTDARGPGAGEGDERLPAGAGGTAAPAGDGTAALTVEVPEPTNLPGHAVLTYRRRGVTYTARRTDSNPGRAKPGSTYVVDLDGTPVGTVRVDGGRMYTLATFTGVEQQFELPAHRVGHGGVREAIYAAGDLAEGSVDREVQVAGPSPEPVQEPMPDEPPAPDYVLNGWEGYNSTAAGGSHREDTGPDVPPTIELWRTAFPSGQVGWLALHPVTHEVFERRSTRAQAIAHGERTAAIVMRNAAAEAEARRNAARAAAPPAAGSLTRVGAGDVRVGDVVVERSIGDGMSRRYRVERVYPPGAGGNVNIDAVNETTGRSTSLTLDGTREHSVVRPDAEPTAVPAVVEAPSERDPAADSGDEPNRLTQVAEAAAEAGRVASRPPAVTPANPNERVVYRGPAENLNADEVPQSVIEDVLDQRVRVDFYDADGGRSGDSAGSETGRFTDVSSNRDGSYIEFQSDESAEGVTYPVDRSQVAQVTRIPEQTPAIEDTLLDPALLTPVPSRATGDADAEGTVSVPAAVEPGPVYDGPPADAHEVLEPGSYVAYDNVDGTEVTLSVSDDATTVLTDDAPTDDAGAPRAARRSRARSDSTSSSGTRPAPVDGPDDDAGTQSMTVLDAAAVAAVPSDGPTFKPTGLDDFAPAGKVHKLEANLAALRLLRTLDLEQRAATPDEQAVLARWSSWGGLPEVFDTTDERYAKYQPELAELMSEKERRAGARASLNAHYTDPRAVKSIWQAVNDLGFTGGRVLEPGSGSGTFIGFAPDSADMVGVELDSTTARISRYLYPQATVRNESFADTRIPDDAFDAAVGNVPFGRISLVDPVHNPNGESMHNHFISKSLSLTRPGGIVALLTSQFTLDAAGDQHRREMAEKADLIGAVRLPTGAHSRIAETPVIEDLLIFRVREPGAERQGDTSWLTSSKQEVNGQTINVNDYFTEHPEHVLGTVSAEPGRFGTGQMVVNGDKTLADLPQVLGSIVQAAQTRGLVATERPQDMERPDLVQADAGRHQGHIQVEDDGTFTQASGGAVRPFPVPASQRQELTDLLAIRDTLSALLDVERTADSETPEMVSLRATLNRLYDGYVAKYGGPIKRFKLSKSGSRIRPPQGGFRRDPMSAVVRALEDYDPSTGTATKAAIFRERVLTRREVATTADTPEDALTLSMDTYGRVDVPAIAGMLGVSEAEARNQLRGLAFEVPPLTEAEQRAAITAYQESLGDLAAAAAALPDTITDTVQVEGGLVPASEYLSGHVRHKLAVARAAAAADPRFQANVDALEARIPPDLGTDEIDGRLGASWVPAEDVEAFVKHLVGEPQWGNKTKVRTSGGGIWTVITDRKGNLATEVWGVSKPTEQFGTPVRSLRRGDSFRFPDAAGVLTDATVIRGRVVGDQLELTVELHDADRTETTVRFDSSDTVTRYGPPKVVKPVGELIQSLLEQRPITVSETIDGKTVQNPQDTLAAQAKAEEIQERFSEWLWEDPDRARRLSARYNDMFNGIALRTYDSTDRAMVGMSDEWRTKVHDHVIKAVDRIVNEPTAMLAHVVGAGKTAEMVMGGAELKRLGLAKKPAYVIPNHMLEQFSREYLEIYPNAKILAAGTEDLTGDGRREFVGRAATGEWDAVILTQTAFESIPMSPGQIEAYIDRELETMRQQLAEAKAADDGDKAQQRTVKKMETAILRAEEQLKKRLMTAKDVGVSFEQTGIDYLFVDEAHQYSNLRTLSNIQSAGASGSNRASDLHMKMEYLRANNDSGRVATFATGTPIRNTVTQAYVMQRYLRPDLLQEAGIHSFDQWAATFGSVVAEMELKPEGKGFRLNNRFAKFRNVPELLRMFHTFADVKMAEDLNLPTPDLAGGQVETVKVERTDALAEFINELGDRAEAVRARQVEPEEDNMLKISMDGRKAALSMALVGGEHEPGKVEAAADRISAIYNDTKDQVYTDPKTGVADPIKGGFQIVFMDLGTPSTKGRKSSDADQSADDGEFDWNGYDALKAELVARGMNADEIRYIHEAKNDDQKAELFAQARAGRIKVLIGSSEKMGVGTNMQKRAVALHHLDAPWRPSDVEQRDGRIMRQGNLNPEVQIIRYVTEGSFDAYMWQTLERKAKFIHQIMRGSLDVREIEDVGDTAMSYAEVKALATGVPELMDLAKVESTVQKLERLERAHARSQTNLRTEASRHSEDIPRHEAAAEAYAEAITRTVPTAGDAFRMTVPGSDEVTDRSEAGPLLVDRIREAAESTRWAYRPAPVPVAEVGGHTITAVGRERRGGSYGTDYELAIDGVPGGGFITSADITTLDTIGSDGRGIIQRIENAITQMPTRRDAHLASAQRARDELERIESRIGMEFTQGPTLVAARAKAERLRAKIARDQARAEGEEVEFDAAIDTDQADSPLVGGPAVADTVVEEVGGTVTDPVFASDVLRQMDSRAGAADAADEDDLDVFASEVQDNEAAEERILVNAAHPAQGGQQAKAKKLPEFLRGGGDKPPAIAVGTYVSWNGGRGRVDLVVTNGKVPGVSEDVEGSKKSPAVRVTVWEKDGSGYKATGKKKGAMAATLKRIPPLQKAGKKSDPAGELVALVAEHEQKILDGTLPEDARVSGIAVKTVFDRGVESWPGSDVTILSAQQWAVGRVKAFLATAAGDRVPHYRRDADLLPGAEAKVAVSEPAEGRVLLDPDQLAADLAAMKG
jgi:N12 class adenine-specific DNA methylase